VTSPAVQTSAPQHCAIGNSADCCPARAVTADAGNGPPATTVRRIALIKMTQRAGFSLAEITQLPADNATPSATRQWRDMATRKLPELDQHIAQAQALRQAVADCLACGCMNFDKCVSLDTSGNTG
jgi:MerR family redox-sensitive transcriptional activator SoxR